MNLWHDVRYGARVLRQSPGFAITAIITLALGIGATTSIFSVCDSLLWRPVPLPAMDRLVMVVRHLPESANDWGGVSAADAEDIRRSATSFESVAQFDDGLANLAGSGGEPERVLQGLVSANFFDVMGVHPERGRAFEPGEDQPGNDHVVILSYKLWQRRFGGDPNIVGGSIRIDDQDYRVAGIMPNRFDFPQATEIWTPLALSPKARANRQGGGYVEAARLKPGIALRQAAAELNNIALRLEKDYPTTNKGRRFDIWPSHDFVVDRYTQQYLGMLLGSVAFVLLIACANVANLQFARATGRLREVAVRTALGAGRGRVIIQLLTENVLLSFTGAVFGLVLANWGLVMMRNGMPPEIARFIVGWQDIHLETRTLLFALFAALASGILAGLAPAWQCSRPNLTDALKEGGRGGTAGKARHRIRDILVAAEVALALVLLVGAGLMVRGFRALIDTGARLQPDTLLTLRMAITDKKYKEPFQVTAFYRDIVQRVSALPGVTNAAAVSAMPYSQHSSGRNFAIEGRPVDPSNVPNAMYQTASASYFDVVHLPLKSGRLLAPADGAEAPRVAVVSEKFARRWWKGESPLGRKIKTGDPDSKNPWMTVVGVVGDITHNTYQRDPRPAVYVPYEQDPQRWMDLGIRTAGDPLRLAPAVTAAIRSVDPEQPITDMQTVAKAIHNNAIGLNYMAVLMGIFGAIALVLSAVGVYGVMAYLVSEQTHEIGIRMALGAQRQNVLKIVFRRGLWTAAVGMLVGLPVAYALARLMESLIFGVTASDPATFIGIPVTLAVASLLAVYIPARRAMRIDPILALRYE